MTREEIIAKWDSMTPRERDAWVAEVVFRHLVVQSGLSDGTVFAYGSGGYNDICPRYSTDISAAWAVLTHQDVYARVIWRHADVWYAEIGDVFVEEPTAPEAICLAAIIASLQSD